jgi:hypothetical protein
LNFASLIELELDFERRMWNDRTQFHNYWIESSLS